MIEHDEVTESADTIAEDDADTVLAETDEMAGEQTKSDSPDIEDVSLTPEEEGTSSSENPADESAADLFPEVEERGDANTPEPEAVAGEQGAGEDGVEEEVAEQSPSASQLSDKELSAILQVLLLVSDKPLSVSKIKTVIEGIDTNKIRELIEGIQQKLVEHGFPFHVREIGGGYVLSTLPEYAQWVRKLLVPKAKASKLSQPALETLAVIAYKQPTTRAEIEAIRGVNVDSTVRTLLDKRLVEIVGYKDIVGKPATYGTTNEFLLLFGLNSLSDLPTIEELRRLNAES
jgi:segregation and condensation protein B